MSTDYDDEPGTPIFPGWLTLTEYGYRLGGEVYIASERDARFIVHRNPGSELLRRVVVIRNWEPVPSE